MAEEQTPEGGSDGDPLNATPPPPAPETEPLKTEPPKTEPPKTKPPKTEPPKTEPPKTEPPKTEPPKTELQDDSPASPEQQIADSLVQAIYYFQEKKREASKPLEKKRADAWAACVKRYENSPKEAERKCAANMRRNPDPKALYDGYDGALKALDRAAHEVALLVKKN